MGWYHCLARQYEPAFRQFHKTLEMDPRMDPLRSDPRFQELAERIGLP